MPPAPTLLELGSGGANNAVHLKAHFAQVTLTDLSPQMLAVSRALNPDCGHLLGDMRTLRLGRAFNVVFIHDAIDYMSTHHDLRLALETAFLHCTPGGWPSSCRITSGRLSSRAPTTVAAMVRDVRCGIWNGPTIRTTPIRPTRWSTPTCCEDRKSVV